jgi:threonine/homoserine/homoserine lactone efflux protein
MSIEFLVTSVVVILLPGTGVLYTLSVGLGQGIKPSIVAAFGCTLGIVPHILASIVGLAAVLHTSAMAFQILKYLGVAYLFYMAWMIMREDGALQVSERRTRTPYVRIILNGILLNVLNPKLTLFFLAFLPQFVPGATGNPTLAMLWLSAVFMLLTLMVFVGYGAFAAAARSQIISRPKVLMWFSRSFAATFGVLGLKLALSEK